MLDRWLRLPPLVRAAGAVGLIVLGVVLFVTASPGVGTVRRGSPLVFVAIGFVLLCMSGPSDSERRGYKF